MERAHRVSRLAYAGLITVFLLLVGMAIASAVVTARASRSAADAGQRARLFDAARFEIGAEESFERKYRLEPSPVVLAAHRQAGERMVRALKRAQSTSGEPIQLLVEDVLAKHRAYVMNTRRMFAAVDAHEAARVIEIDQGTESVFTAMQTTVFDEATKADGAEARASAGLLRVENAALTVMVIVASLGVVALYGIFTVLRRYKAEVDDAVAKEIYDLKEAALTDLLTGLGNHRAYQESFGDQIKDCRSSGHSLSIALVDVDELKVLNDRHGHMTGDRLLASLATILRSSDFRWSTFRLGGDGFALTFAGMPMDAARAHMEEVRAIAEAELDGTTVSIGLATMTDLDNDPVVLFEQADAALHEAKRRGRNAIVSFDEIRAESGIFLPARVAQVRKLIETGAIGVAFQPIWNVEGRSLVGYEALARPGGEDPINPQDAFDIAERIGRAHDLDRVCREAVLRRARTFPAGSLLFMNVSPQSFDHAVFDDAALRRAVELVGLTPDRVVLEITERSIARLGVVVREATRLRALGFALALDDAGSGNSGLEMLSQLDVDYVKIDREVIVRAQSGKGRPVLAGIVAIAHEMGAQIIAEGIEDAEMLDFIMMATRNSTIPTAVQGYFVGRPSLEFVDAAGFALAQRRLAESGPAIKAGA
jgi:diguanylate cyclase (GGDEF)-like protein